MKNVRIAELKARLSEHLRAVRRGHPLTVLDRETPVARIVPCESDASVLTVRKPVPGSAPSKISLPPPMRIGKDIVALLLEDRSRDR
jgi:prevent-host-death family protein